jgi:nanoRNase/pAp phosphatase (c-di-AMP/oligoRNAs hydrolase)
MVPITVVSAGGGGERKIERGGQILGIARSKLLEIGKALLRVSSVATHKEPDFDGLFSAWAVNVLRGHSKAKIYSGKGAAAGIEKRVPGLLNNLGIELADIKNLSGSYALFDASKGSNKNVGASYEPDVCIDTHFGAGQQGGKLSLISSKHAAVSTIITAIIHATQGDSFWRSELGKNVAAGLFLGIQTDCGMNNPTTSSVGLYGTDFDRMASDYLRSKVDRRIIGQYVSSPFWDLVDRMVEKAVEAIGQQDSQNLMIAAYNPSLPRADSDLTGVVAERLLDRRQSALCAVYGAFLEGGGFKVSFRLNPNHIDFNPKLVGSAIGPMVEATEAICPGGEASWRSEGRVLGGFWPVQSVETAKAVLKVLLNVFGNARKPLGDSAQIKRRERRGRGTVA